MVMNQTGGFCLGAKGTHGFTSRGVIEKTYNIWRSIRNRCRHDKNWAGRGIRVCEEWHNYANFRTWALSSGFKPGLTLERINNDGDYEPSNCKWATFKEQARNRRSSVFLTFNDMRKTISEWAEITGLSQTLIWARINKMKWSVEKALSTPVRKYFEKKKDEACKPSHMD